MSLRLLARYGLTRAAGSDPPSGQVQFIAAAGASGSANQQSVNVPAGTANGDVMVYATCRASQSDDRYLVWDSEWAELYTDSFEAGTGFAILSIGFRVASDEGASVAAAQWRSSSNDAISSTQTVSSVRTYRGANTVNPVEASSQANVNADGDFTAAGLTPGGLGRVAELFAVADLGLTSSAFTWPSGYAQADGRRSSTPVYAGSAYRELPSADATGALAATFSTGNRSGLVRAVLWRP